MSSTGRVHAPGIGVRMRIIIRYSPDMPSPRSGSGARRGASTRRRRNLLHAAGRESVTYRDVDLLRTFISDRGKIRSRRLTGLTPQQQRQVTRSIKTAREMALLPYAARR